ncbi:sensor histidine kinase [Oxalicibacterium faecigallinarum]|uniref:histidine kinase n=1 Tax=Oxalicibacterium faecigallinarum TaxID=573741 RepID=A0A8J3AWS8_9BURK|nr:sensor histidine kinase [Oxalicibacterium faecigallinarum]GGI18026.1 hypothetical protein GCM10008066_11930 [Oxalicibacterium faecigallinarum]
MSSIFSRLFFLLISCLLVTVLPVHANAVLSLDQSRNELEGHLYALVDDAKALTFEQVLSQDVYRDFVPLSGNPKREKLDAAVWLKFSVTNPNEAQTEWWLEVQPAVLEKVDLYVPEGPDNHMLYQDGSSRFFSERAVGYRHPVFKLNIPAGTQQTYYLRIDSGIWRTARLTLWQPTTFIAAIGKEQLLFGVYIGLYALLVLAGLWFERAMRDRVYLCFSLYVASCIFTTLTSTGLWQQYVMPSHPQWFNGFYSLSVTLMIGCCVQFFVVFVQLHRQRPKLTRYFLGSVWAFCALMCAISIAGNVRYAMFAFWLLVFVVIVPASVIVLWRPALRSTSEIRWTFVFGGLLLLGCYLYSSLVRYQWLPATWFAENAMYLSSLLFFLIVFYAISRHYYEMRRQAERAQREVMRMTQRSGQELERLVHARTDELLQTQRSLETALLHAQAIQQEQRQFIATVSHEVRTPLAVIDATAQNLNRETPADAVRSKARVEKISQATKRLALLFDDYLNDERFELFSQGVTPQETAIRPLLADAVEATQSLSDQHGFEIDCDPAALVWADPYGLRLILRTLVDNAVKYSQSGSRIVLRVINDNDRNWQIDVCDNGASIPEEERARVFERYFRGRGSANRVGTGIGLTLARRFVEQHGGELQLICPPEGGNIFRIRLPQKPY